MFDCQRQLHIFRVTCVQFEVCLSGFSSSVARGISAASMSSSIEIFIARLTGTNAEGLPGQEGDVVSNISAFASAGEACEQFTETKA